MSVQLKAAGLATDIRKSILDSVAGAARKDQPYPNWRLTSLFPEPAARELADLPFAPTRLDGVSGRRELHNDDRRYFAGDVLDRYPIARDVAETFQSPEIVGAFAKLTGTDLTGTFLRVEYALDVEGFWLEPHTDLGVKSLTLLYQLPAEGHQDLGTDIYAAADKWVERAPFVWNGALLFIPSDNTWHGFEPRPIPGVRRSIIINYVTNDWRAREQLAFDGQPVSVG